MDRPRFRPSYPDLIVDMHPTEKGKGTPAVYQMTGHSITWHSSQFTLLNNLAYQSGVEMAPRAMMRGELSGIKHKLDASLLIDRVAKLKNGATILTRVTNGCLILQ